MGEKDSKSKGDKEQKPNYFFALLELVLFLYIMYNAIQMLRSW